MSTDEWRTNGLWKGLGFEERVASVWFSRMELFDHQSRTTHTNPSPIIVLHRRNAEIGKYGEEVETSPASFSDANGPMKSVSG